jgi:hypothetical protein
VSALLIDPQNSGTVYAVTASGIFKTLDRGMSWSAANMGLPETHVLALTLDPQDPGTLYAGTLSGVFTSTDGAQSWSALYYPGLRPGGVWQLSFDPRSPTTLYAVAGGEVFEITFVPSSQPAPSVIELTLNPSVVRLEGSYAAVFAGSNLTDKTYFDIRYRLPDSAVDREVQNWQQGAAASHTVPSPTILGTWTITGIRVHYDADDHSAALLSLSVQLRVVLF